MAVTYPSASSDATKRVLANCFYVPPVQREVSGYKLSDNLDSGTVIPMGTPIVASTANKTAKICKYAVVEKKVDAKNFILKDLGFLAVGDTFFISGAESPTLSTISAIDTTTRQITLSANNNSLAAGNVIVEGESVTSGGTTTVQPVNVPNRIVSHTATLGEIDKTVSGTYQCVAIQNVLNYPEEYLNKTTFPGSVLLVGCPTIHFVTI